MLVRVQGLRFAPPALRGGACGALDPASARRGFAVVVGARFSNSAVATTSFVASRAARPTANKAFGATRGVRADGPATDSDLGALLRSGCRGWHVTPGGVLHSNLGSPL